MEEECGNSDMPTNDAFQHYFTRLYIEEESVYLDSVLDDYDNNIRVLDIDISMGQVYGELHNMKTDKASGPDGLCPTVRKILSFNWIMTLPSLFNAAFKHGCYTEVLRITKMFPVKKKSCKMLVVNYRPISVMNCVTKLYNMMCS